MFQQERQKKVLDYVNARKKVTTTELSEKFDTSVVTIRADITALDKKGLVEKVRGGAIAVTERFNVEIPVSSKARKNAADKRVVGRLAASQVEDDDIIILDTGTTTMEIARSLPKFRNLTVITNDIQIASYLAANAWPGLNLLVAGGTLEAKTFSLLGLETLDFYKKLKVNKVFLGCDAVSAETGVSNRTLIEADIKAAMIRCADRVYAVVDGSKIGKTVFARVCDIGDIDVLITNRIAPGQRELFAGAGVEVLTPEEQE